MKSIRRNVFETNSSSTHSLSINNHNRCVDDLEYRIPKDESIVIGNEDDCAFLSNLDNKEFKDFREKLSCLLAVFIAFYDDLESVDLYAGLYEKFKHGCHYIWICEMLKEKCNCTLELRPFRYSNLYLEDIHYFVENTFPLYYPEKFKESIWDIVGDASVTMEYYSESW